MLCYNVPVTPANQKPRVPKKQNLERPHAPSKVQKRHRRKAKKNPAQIAPLNEGSKDQTREETVSQQDIAEPNVLVQAMASTQTGTNLRGRPGRQEPTRSRMTQVQRTRIIESGRAIFLAMAKNVKQQRASKHTLLREHIVKLALPGMVGIQTSTDAYYAVLFKSAELRDAAMAAIDSVPFAVNDVQIPLYTHAFVDMRSRLNVIWSVPAGALCREKDIKKAVTEHCAKHHPNFSTTFEVRAKKEMGVRTGEFAVRFDNPPHQNSSSSCRSTTIPF
jgi:hypothetical protein